MTAPARLDMVCVEKMALRRVRRGGVAVFEGLWLYRGRPMPEGLLRELYGLLVAENLLEVRPADEYGLRRVALSDQGEDRYLELVAQRPTPLRVSEPEHATASQSPADHRLSDPCTALGDRPAPS